MENPVAMSSESGRETPRRGPSHIVPRKVMVTTAMTTSSSAPPNSMTWETASCDPRSTMPNRSTRLAVNLMPGVHTAGTAPRLPSTTPMTSDATSGDTVSKR